MCCSQTFFAAPNFSLKYRQINSLNEVSEEGAFIGLIDRLIDADLTYEAPIFISWVFSKYFAEYNSSIHLRIYPMGSLVGLSIRLESPHKFLSMLNPS